MTVITVQDDDMKNSISEPTHITSRAPGKSSKFRLSYAYEGVHNALFYGSGLKVLALPQALILCQGTFTLT